MIMNDAVSANAFLKRTTSHCTVMIKPRASDAVSDCYTAERLLTTASTAAAHRRMHITDKRRSCRSEVNGISMREPVKELYVFFAALHAVWIGMGALLLRNTRSVSSDFAISAGRKNSFRFLRSFFEVEAKKIDRKKNLIYNINIR